MEVKTIAVIGAGLVGRGIAYAAASSGHETVLEDISSRLLAEAVAWIRQSFEEEVASGKVEPCARDKALSLITTAGDVKDAIRDAELIIETVPDELEMKLELFTIFDKFAKSGAIFASTATSLSITDFTTSLPMRRATSRHAATVSRERCIGMHFFEPLLRTKQMELVRTAYTSEETVAACREVARRMGKEVAVVNEEPQTV